MITYHVDNYESVGPKFESASYMVRSRLPRGQAHISSANISAKLVLTGSEVYRAGRDRFPLHHKQFLLTSPIEELDLTIGSSAWCECALKSKCTTGKNRRISRWEHETILDELDSRMEHAPEILFCYYILH